MMVSKVPGYALDVICFGDRKHLNRTRWLDTIQIVRDKNAISDGKDTIRLPRIICDLKEEILRDKMGDWMPVVHWLRDRIGQHAILLIDFADPLRELCLFAASNGLFRYALLLSQAPSWITPADYPILTSARCLVFPDHPTEVAFRPLYPAFYHSALLEEGPAAIAPGPLACDAPPYPDVLHPACQTRQTIRILLVGYFSGPARTVGVKRVNHWLARIPEFAPHVRVELVTATPWDNPPDTVHVIPDPGPAAVLNPDGTAFDWAEAFVEDEKRNARSFATLSQYWRIAIERYFQDRSERYDVVIISGNPFAVFDFASFAKRVWYASVILDYRDPFANNPRIAFSDEGRAWARYIERGYNFQADLVTVVNDDCVPMVEAREDVPVKVIANGYDERDLVAPVPQRSAGDNLIHFVHAGSILHDRSPKALLGTMDTDRHVLHHIGNTTGLDDEDLSHAHLKTHGMLAYEEVMRHVSAANCGVVFTSETGFETPTKLYDYLAYGLDILIVTHGPLRHGAVHLTVGDLDGVYWTSNTSESLRAFMQQYEPSQERRAVQHRERFSRENSLFELLEEIQRITGLPLYQQNNVLDPGGIQTD